CGNYEENSSCSRSSEGYLSAVKPLETVGFLNQKTCPPVCNQLSDTYCLKNWEVGVGTENISLTLVFEDFSPASLLFVALGKYNGDLVWWIERKCPPKGVALLGELRIKPMALPMLEVPSSFSFCLGLCAIHLDTSSVVQMEFSLVGCFPSGQMLLNAQETDAILTGVDGFNEVANRYQYIQHSHPHRHTSLHINKNEKEKKDFPMCAPLHM
ncbi:hypothetical protein STEG23_006889, partial [Scotinomys teguina]